MGLERGCHYSYCSEKAPAFPADPESSAVRYSPAGTAVFPWKCAASGDVGMEGKAVERGPGCPRFRILSPNTGLHVEKEVPVRCTASDTRMDGAGLSERRAGWPASAPHLDRPAWAGVLRPGSSPVGAGRGRGPARVPGEAEAAACLSSCVSPTREGGICGTRCKVLGEGLTSVSAGVETTQQCPWDIKSAHWDFSFVFIKRKRTESLGMMFQGTL